MVTAAMILMSPDSRGGCQLHRWPATAERDGSDHLFGCLSAASCCGFAGMLLPRVPSDEGRSDGGASTRIGLRCEASGARNQEQMKGLFNRQSPIELTLNHDA
jgi:hypothetical protein